MTLRRTLSWDESIAELPESEIHGLYGTSWAFFYSLYNNQQEAFARYQIALAKGVNPKKAWDAAFPGFDPDALDPVLYDYLVHGKGAVDTLPLRTSAPSIDVKAMSAADAHAVRARIALTGASTVKEDERKARLTEANAELKKALDLDPTSVDALLLATSMPSDTLLEAARASAAAHPGDSRIHALLGDLLNDRDEREAAYRRALQIDHDDPQILDSLAKLLIALHRPDEAFPLALRASQRAPHDITAARAGLLTDVHPWDRAPFHLQAELDFVRGSWNGAPGDPNSSKPHLPIDEASIGYFVHVSAGLVWRVHHYELGPSLRVHYASLGSEHTDATLWGVTGLVGFFL
jgi:tetratricopeptide (TPR) repeat protein